MIYTVQFFKQKETTYTLIIFQFLQLITIQFRQDGLFLFGNNLLVNQEQICLHKLSPIWLDILAGYLFSKDSIGLSICSGWLIGNTPAHVFIKKHFLLVPFSEIKKKLENR